MERKRGIEKERERERKRERERGREIEREREPNYAVYLELEGDSPLQDGDAEDDD